MYCAYKIEVNELNNFLSNQSKYFKISERWRSKESMNSDFLRMIRESSLVGDSLYADEIWNKCFPEIRSDIFISHSHNDFSLAKKFANWLHQNQKLDAFIDSEFWWDSDELQEIIDNKYCFDPDSNLYDYEARNESTAHVHMMLLYALSRMINKTDFFIFLESSNSTKSKNPIQRTDSPWIFYEIATVDNILRERKRIYQSMFAQESDLSESVIPMQYPLLGEELVGLYSNNLLNLNQLLQDEKEKGQNLFIEFLRIMNSDITLESL